MRKAKAASGVLVKLVNSNPELVEKLFSKWTVTGSEETLRWTNVTEKKQNQQKNTKKKNIEKIVEKLFRGNWKIKSPSYRG